MEVIGLTAILTIAILIIALISYFKHLGNYNNKFRKLEEEHKKQVEEQNNLIESQKNVILSQRSELATLNVGLERLKTKNETTESQKKSSEVKLGLMAENFMPFIRDYPYDHKNFRFLANPVDGLQINDDSIVFVEFKTGGAKLSKSQKHIKDLVGKGKVRFETFRVDETGSSLKLESIMENNDQQNREYNRSF